MSTAGSTSNLEWPRHRKEEDKEGGRSPVLDYYGIYYYGVLLLVLLLLLLVRSTATSNIPACLRPLRKESTLRWEELAR